MDKKLKIKHWGILSLIWTGILLLVIGQSWKTGLLLQEFSFYLIIWAIGICLYLFQVGILLNTRLIKNWRWYLIAQILIALVVAAIYQQVDSVSLNTMPLSGPGVEWQALETTGGLMKFVSGNAFSVFYLYLIHTSIGLLWGYNQIIRQKENEEARLKVKLMQSQIKSLQSELQPHFLFNTLHTISSLMEEDVGKAQVLLEKLSDILRLYLGIIESLYYTFHEELEFIENYLEIHRIRSNNSIVFDVQVSDECRGAMVPVIFFQPIIENCIKHGWTDRKQPFTILLSAVIEKEILSIRIEDSGLVKKHRVEEGIGSRNLRERLTALYNNNYVLNYQLADGKFITHIQIPVKTPFSLQ